MLWFIPIKIANFNKENRIRCRQGCGETQLTQLWVLVCTEDSFWGATGTFGIFKYIYGRRALASWEQVTGIC